MPRKDPVEIIPYFTWTHFATDGKMDNIAEALNGSPISRICLNILDPSMDDIAEFLADREEMLSRLARCKKTIARFKRTFDITADLVLPGIRSIGLHDQKGKKNLTFLYAHAPQTKARVIWMDEEGLAFDFLKYYTINQEAITSFQKRKGHRISKKRMQELQYRASHEDKSLSAKEKKIANDFDQFEKNWLFQSAKQLAGHIHTHDRRVTVGLIGGDLGYDSSWERGILKQVSNNDTPHHIFTPCLPNSDDIKRTDILKLAIHLSVTRRHVSLHHTGASISACPPSPFHKSAESMQMDMQLNILFRRNPVLLDCFDDAGTDPGSNPYLTMMANRARLNKKLYELLPVDTAQGGIRLLLKSDYNESHWADMFMRMGFPLLIDTPETFDAKSNSVVTIMTDEIANKLTRSQIDSIFANGVFLDIVAAKTLKELGYSEYLGVTFGKMLENAQYEILSDQMLAAPFYGHRTDLSAFERSYWDCSLTPLNPNTSQTRTLTTLLQENKLPNTPGMSYYENAEKERYCAILPYAIADQTSWYVDYLLTIQRQRHFHDLFISLGRKRLPCFVENAPDLVPFYFADPKGRRVILALLNVSFDWAIDARIRLGQLPEKTKTVRELDDHGKLLSYRDLKITRAGGYHYLQLTSDTAVPPMQMGIFILE